MTSSYLIAEAALLEDKFVHAFPTFGPERSGAPIAAFARISDEKFYVKTEVYEPDIVVVQDPSLLSQIDVTAGLQEGGIIFPNTPMMKFADGGSPLENGLGHSRKSGKLSGYGGGDKVKALLEAGEFIIKKEAVQKLGLDRLHMLNQGQLPRFKDGGHVTPMQKFNTGGLVKTELNSSGTKGTVNLNLTVGNKTFPMISDEQVAESLASYLQGSEF